MKRLLLLSMMVVAVISQASASVRTIIKPEHIYQNMLARLLTDSVTLSDTATIFHLRILKRDERAVFFSHDTCLRDKKDRTYPLRQLISDDGLKPDEPTTFEDIGKNTLSIRFVFPPLPADVAEVDMIDPQFYNQGIFGIRLDGSPLPPLQLPKDIEDRLKEIMAQQDTLPKVDYRFGWATIKGHLMDYRPGMCSQMTLVLCNVGYRTYRLSDTLSTLVSPTGDFTFRLPVAHITPVSLELEPSQPRGYGVAYVGPDTETEVYFNMREINDRYINYKISDKPILYVTKGPLAQQANELNEHIIFYHIDFIQKYFKHNFTNKEMEEWERLKAIRAMLPTKQLELRMAQLDTMKVEEQCSPAFKELVKLYWQINTVMELEMIPSNELETKANRSPEAKERLMAWQRDAVVAEIEAFERILNNPKLVFCPELNNLLEFFIRVNTVFPAFLDYERTAWKIRNQMSTEFMLLDNNEIAETMANLPLAYQQWLRTWQDKYREEHDRLAAREMVADTLQGIPDSLVFQTLCERYRGHTIFVCFWPLNYEPFAKKVLLPLQQELADLDIVWVNVFNRSLFLNRARWGEANWLRYFTKLEGEHYYFHMSSRLDWIRELYKPMGISNPMARGYCIVAPDGRIVRNGDDKPIPISWMNGEDYLGIRQCLLKTASPR